MSVSAEGRADVAVSAFFADGSKRRLAAWSDVVSEAVRILGSRSPDGGRIAVAAGRFVRTISAADET